MDEYAVPGPPVPPGDYIALAEAIARCVHADLSTEVDSHEPEDGRRVRVIVDNACESGMQIATGVLSRLNILVPLDPLGRRHAFTCDPNGFRDTIARHEADGCTYDTLVLAAICLLENHHRASGIVPILTRLGIVEPHDDGSGFAWTIAKQRYDTLYADWPRLIDRPA